MNVWTFYDPATGLLTGDQYSGPAVFLALNTPPGRKAIEGYVDQDALDVALSQDKPAEP